MTRADFETGLSQWLHRQWLTRGWLSVVMRPFSWIVLLILALRRKFYILFPGTVYQARVPVLVIGNIYVGGTGKTPVVIALVKALTLKGWRPGVISRGYGTTIGNKPRIGQGVLAPDQFGDEPALIAHQTGAPIAVHPNRKKAIEALLAYAPETDLIVSDDGLQHLALARNLEIIVEDLREVGNGCVMPAGPLRETIDRLEHVQAIVTNVPQLGLLRQRDSKHLQYLAKPGPQMTAMALQIGLIRNLMRQQTLTFDQFLQLSCGHTLAGAAGIGAPERFFESLRSQGLVLSETLALPDHHTFTANTFYNLRADYILITAKDAIKCSHLQDERLWVVEVDAVFSDPGFTDWLNQAIRTRYTNASPH